jgi:histidyl-tRNA synthetase
VLKLRGEGLHVEMEQAGRSVKGQFRHADRVGARNVVIVGDGIEIKDMETGEQRSVEGVDEVVRELVS